MSEITVENVPANVRDLVYYLEETIFQIENVLFRIPRQYFERESDFFREMFNLPVPKGHKVDGLSDVQPLVLNTVTAADFRRFLKVIYSFDPHEAKNLKSDDYLSALKLATMWGFDRLRRDAISHLTQLDGVEMVVLSREYHVEEWLIPGLEKLVNRPNSMTMADEKRLGTETVIKICALREASLSQAANRNNNNNNYNNNNQTPFDAVKMIRNMFVTEIGASV